MFKQELKNETISLGAIYQACNEIKKIAWQGEINISIIEPLINSVYQTTSNDIEDIYIGTAHRGRLTLLSSVMEVPLRSIMAKFEGGGEDPNEILGSGDVKYHLGISSDREFEDKKIHLSLTPNPSPS